MCQNTVFEAICDDFTAHLSECRNVAFQAAVTVLRHHHDAEDVAQQALVRAFQNYGRLRDRNRFPCWLARISRRLALNHSRSDRTRTVREAASINAVTAATVIDELLERERSERLWKCINRLPLRLRIVTVLVAIQERRVREVALMLHVSEGPIKKQLFLARRHLRKLLTIDSRRLRRGGYKT